MRVLRFLSACRNQYDIHFAGLTPSLIPSPPLNHHEKSQHGAIAVRIRPHSTAHNQWTTTSLCTPNAWPATDNEVMRIISASPWCLHNKFPILPTTLFQIDARDNAEAAPWHRCPWSIRSQIASVGRKQPSKWSSSIATTICPCDHNRFWILLINHVLKRLFSR